MYTPTPKPRFESHFHLQNKLWQVNILFIFIKHFQWNIYPRGPRTAIIIINMKIMLPLKVEWVFASR